MTYRSTSAAAVAVVCALAALTACSSSSGSVGSSRATTNGPHVAATTTTQAAAHPLGHAAVHITGGLQINASGNGAICDYFIPAEHQGVTYHVGSGDLQGTSNAGGWDLTLTDDTTDPTRLAIDFNTDRGAWTWSARFGGTVHADPRLHHADFDVLLVKAVGHQQARLTGHLDCP